MAVRIDGIYPTVQVHFSTDRPMTEDDQKRVEAAVRLPLSGFVEVRFTPRRIILTSSQPPDEGEKYARQMAGAIESVLGR